MSQKTALVIGASGGLGRAIALMLAEEDYALALVGRDVEKLQSTRSELGAAAQSALLLTCDLTDRAQAQAMVEQVLAQLSYIDVLICAAGLNVRHRRQSYHSFQCDSLCAAVDAHAGRRFDRADLISRRIAREHHHRGGVFRG